MVLWVREMRNSGSKWLCRGKRNRWLLELGWNFTQYIIGCNSCHPMKGKGNQFGMFIGPFTFTLYTGELSELILR